MTTFSYATDAEAALYLADRPGMEFWRELSVEKRTALLVLASRRLDDAMIWPGEPVSADQSAGWPRKYTSFPEDSIPECVGRAAAEEALSLASPGKAASARWKNSGIRSASVGGMSLSLENCASGLCEEALLAVRGLGRPRASALGKTGAKCGILSRG